MQPYRPNRRPLRVRIRRNRRRKREENESDDLPPKKRESRRIKKQLKLEEIRGNCEIGGSSCCQENEEGITPDVPLVKFDNCKCRKLCRVCAVKWVQQSSTCPFCRATIGKIDRSIVSHKEQRGDHDIMTYLFSFRYTNVYNEVAEHRADVPTSKKFANKRAQTRVNKYILYLIYLCETLHEHQIENSYSYYKYTRDILWKKIKTKKQRNVVLRILVYLAVNNQSHYALFVLNSVLRDDITIDFDIFDNKTLTISKAIFETPPHPPKNLLMDRSAFQIWNESNIYDGFKIAVGNMFRYRFPAYAQMFPDVVIRYNLLSDSDTEAELIARDSQLVETEEMSDWDIEEWEGNEETGSTEQTTVSI